MGLFSTQHTTTFSSVVYNLAGPEANRPDYLKTTVLGAIVGDAPSLADTLTGAYLGGPGIQLRGFAQWAQQPGGLNDAVGLIDTTLVLAQTVDQGVLAAQIPTLVTVGSGQTVEIQQSSIGQADFTKWADQYVATHYPACVGTAYTADIDPTSNTITVTFVGGATTSFVATGYDPAGMYLYAVYNLVDAVTVGPLVTGTTINVTDVVPMPSITGWTADSTTSTAESMTLNTVTEVVVSYSDHRTGTDTTSTTTSTQVYTDTVSVWEKTTYQGTAPVSNVLTSLRQVMTQTETGTKVTTPVVTVATTTISGGVIQTTTTTVNTDTLVMAGTYRIDTQNITSKTWSAPAVMIYKQGSGNTAMDAMFQTSTSAGQFFPFIPLRIAKQFVSPSFFGDIYALGKSGIKRSINGSFDQMVSDISNNASLGDIDQAYVVYGVSLNVQENACRQYIYDFFLQIMEGQSLDGSSYLAWETAAATANAQIATWQTWFTAQGDPTSPLYGTTEPPNPSVPAAPISSVVVGSSLPGVNFQVLITWNGVIETFGSGLLTPGAVPGQVWFEILGDGSTLRLNRQLTGNTWSYLDIYGLTNTYSEWIGHNVVVTTAAQAMANSAESGFIIPLQQDIFSQTNLVSATQMSTACCFLVFTCTSTVATPWYSSDIFKILLVVVIIVIAVIVSIATMGAATPGLLGTAGTVGGALGLTGTAAVIAGTVVNAIAAMVLVQIINTASTSILGPKIGPIIGAIASVIAVSATTSFMSGMSLSSNFSGMTLASNLTKLTIATGSGVAEYQQAAVQDTLKQTQDLLTSYNTESQTIKTQTDTLLGMNGIDPMALLNPLPQISAVEPLDTFLTRTLMTGTDIAGVSLDMISSYADITLTTALPL